MAKKKAELEADAAHYRRAVSAMRKAHNERQVMEAIRIAMGASEFVDGMMQFERRFEERTERRSIETIDYVLQYAPLVFDFPSLESLTQLLKSQKRIDKNTTADLAEGLQRATELMWEAHRLWTVLEQSNEVRQDGLRSALGGDQERWRRICELWDEMGIVCRVPEKGSYRVSIATRITAEARGKCRSCGATGKAELERLLESITCPKCKSTATFVLIPPPAPTC